MNRWLIIPAVCCGLAFAALLATLYGGVDGSDSPSNPDAITLNVEQSDMATQTPEREGGSEPLLTIDEAQQFLTTITTEYTLPWRQWEQAPYHRFSRAAPRNIPTISTDIVINPDIADSDLLLAATIELNTGASTQSIACVVDRTSRRVLLFVEGKWQTSDEWIETAPTPNGRVRVRQ
jgi:hypothetical protein